MLKVEQGKDGTLDTKLFDASAEKQGDLSLYTLVSEGKKIQTFRVFTSLATLALRYSRGLPIVRTSSGVEATASSMC